MHNFCFRKFFPETKAAGGDSPETAIGDVQRKKLGPEQGTHRTSEFSK